MYEHTSLLYSELLSRADEGGMFVGSKVEAFRATGLAQGYYSKLYGYLAELGCIVQVQRGSRRQSSIVQLVRPPTPEEFTALYASPLTKPKTLATLDEELLNVKRRLEFIERHLGVKLDSREEDHLGETPNIPNNYD